MSGLNRRRFAELDRGLRHIFLASCMFLCINNAHSNPECGRVHPKSDSLREVITSYKLEAKQVFDAYNASIATLKTNHQQSKLAVDSPYSKSLYLQEIATLKRQLEVDIRKIRYKKGIDLIRLLHEKILSLDYHFSSMRTQEEISAMYNPNSYPVYAEFAKDYNSTSEKGSNSLLSSFNLSNPYISAIASITSLLGRKGSNTTSQDVEVGCIIDFTLANTTSLAVVQAESAFITEGFHELKGEVLSLFEDYMSVVDYNVSLTRCRKEDD